MSQEEILAQALMRVLKHTHDDGQDVNDRAIHIKQVIENLLLGPSLLVKPTQRVAALENIDAVTSMDQHIKNAASFFIKFVTFGKRTCAVVFGLKHQGKSQFLLFLAKLLIALGEGIVYLDQTIAPGSGDAVAAIDPASSPNCCLAVWKSNLRAYLLKHAGSSLRSMEMRSTVLRALDEFSKDGKPESFRTFRFNLQQLCQSSQLRIWMIVDDATSETLQNFPILWPEEQSPTPFHFELTGSVGIAAFVQKKHLEMQVWDLPLFDPQEMAGLALRLQVATNVIEGTLGLQLDDEENKIDKLGAQNNQWVAHWLHGGIVGAKKRWGERGFPNYLLITFTATH
ncbi:Aste57867_9974 [Aphanomyces stellatus]|uniref:Aste57867_9974 protein n=1 Tax=Aphanomyces stellatus TaxID=120398 RepID=A0A485KP70_9STRA|nr:hypothetical protein As57867_009935 [Aphanomyces stellatus]VFT86852.1 Aste57867_9974 [Aphanomyces stellatus]